ncbi:MAG TPA: YciI family protein [Sphingopyxis sp.]|nr:YciI family protein [Sphingopyxis sp.]HMP45007.1 YciI family protein [Sphingopyxis sp.]HMQ18812.1 YciI family protein [Sphingopyxis sp.]
MNITMPRNLAGLLLSAALALTGAPALAQGGASEAEAAKQDERPLFTIHYRAGPNWRPGVPMEQQGLVEHFYFIRDLHARGVILLAGPLGADGGLIILQAADAGEVAKLMASDPAVVAGLFVGEVQPFVLRFVGSKPLTPVPPRR